MEKILIVDNEKRMVGVLQAALTEAGREVLGAYDGDSALQVFEEEKPILVITDLKMEGMDGLELLRRIKEKSPQTEVILMTAYATAQTAVEAMKEGAYDYLIKPFDTEELKTKVRHIVEKKSLERENIDLKAALRSKYAFENIVGGSGRMQEVFRLVERVAPSDATVLLRGDSGTGKELIARAIHHHSPRDGKPFVVVNCAALPETLLESELFGYEKGAFTGADRSKPGHFELAGDGTIFLDEIGEMVMATQAKLLRVLQNREVLHLGGRKPIPIRARTIVATNKDLEKAMAEGSFREDLYYRINVFPIVLPPLRERREDIPDLVAFFLERSRFPNKVIEGAAVEALMAYAWPGNVRELENVIERAFILAGEREIRLEDLPPQIRDRTAASGGVEIPEGGLNIEEVEKSLIRKALSKTEGNKSRAAELLGITRRKLYSMMERLGISV